MSDSIRHIMALASTAITGYGDVIPAHYVPARAHFSYRSPALMTLNKPLEAVRRTYAIEKPHSCFERAT